MLIGLDATQRNVLLTPHSPNSPTHIFLVAFMAPAPAQASGILPHIIRVPEDPVPGLFSSKKAAETAIAEVKTALKYDEEDPNYFFGIAHATPITFDPTLGIPYSLTYQIHTEFSTVKSALFFRCRWKIRNKHRCLFSGGDYFTPNFIYCQLDIVQIIRNSCLKLFMRPLQSCLLFVCHCCCNVSVLYVCHSLTQSPAGILN